MKTYELTCLLPPTLLEEGIAGVSEKIKNAISEQSGVLQKELKPVKKKFGYQIKQHQEGFLITFLFALNPESLDPLKKKVEEEASVLRCMTTTKNQSEQKKPSLSPKRREQDKKVGLREIDKKINEILKE